MTNFVCAKKIIGTIDNGKIWGLSGVSPSCHPRLIGEIKEKERSEQAFQSNIMLLVQDVLFLVMRNTTYLKHEISSKVIAEKILLNIAKCKISCIWSSDQNERLQFFHGEIRLRIGNQAYGKSHPIYYKTKDML